MEEVTKLVKHSFNFNMNLIYYCINAVIVLNVGAPWIIENAMLHQQCYLLGKSPKESVHTYFH